MDQDTIERLAKLIVSIAKQKPQKLAGLTSANLPEIDPDAQALCRDIFGKVISNEESTAVDKIGEAVTQCKIQSTNEDNKKIFTAIKAII